MAFLDAEHGEGWAIWEFRAEGTGYPDEAVYGRIRHYPWPDHHPPPFRLVPLIMASMKNWLGDGDAEGIPAEDRGKDGQPDAGPDAGTDGEKKRVVVVHCKAGKGRSGTMATSYLISERGWTPEDALSRFTERRMRPNFGAGVSIPSQLRWVDYVDRWTKGGKKFVDRDVEIVELHVWGLRHGVKVSVEGYIDDGKKIRVVHTFKAEERLIVEGGAPGGAGVRDFVSDVAEGLLSPTREDDDLEGLGGSDFVAAADDERQLEAESSATSENSQRSNGSKTANILRSLSRRKPRHTIGPGRLTSKQQTGDDPKVASQPALSSTLASSGTAGKGPSGASLQPRPTTFAAQDEPGGQAVVFKPSRPIIVDNGDVNIALERRNRAPATMGLTMVTAVAHVWFNTFFEGRGPEQDGNADDAGVFEIDWDRMDGIKGSSQKGTKAADRIAVVWRTPIAAEGEDSNAPAVQQMGEGEGDTNATDDDVSHAEREEPVPQMEAADWRGGNAEDLQGQRHLGLRTADPESEGVSRASSVKSGLGLNAEDGSTTTEAPSRNSMAGVKTSGPEGNALEATALSSGSAKTKGASERV